MKNITIYAASVVIMLFLASCGNVSKWYEATCVNVGTQTIIVNEFPLGRQESVVICGELLPGQEKVCGPFTRRPPTSIDIQWSNTVSGVVTTSKLHLKLPEHYEEYSTSIVFYFDPNNSQCLIAYSLCDLETSKERIVDSDGNAVNLGTNRR